MLISSDVWEKYDSINNTSKTVSPIIVLVVIVTILTLFIAIRVIRNTKRRLSPEDKLLTADVIDEMPIDTFLDLTDVEYDQANDKGCYLLYNTDKEKYYIGRSIACADAVNRQLIGKGSPDIFYEKKDGDDFTVQFYFIASGSEYDNINDLYNDVIAVYGENSEIVSL